MKHHEVGSLEEAQRLYQQGNALAMQGRIDQAIAHYERALSLRPDYAEAHANLGNALAMQGRIDPAIEHYQRAVALQPNFAPTYNNLGLALALQGQTDRAISRYERALSLRPDYPEAHTNLGNALMAQGRIDPAIEHYQRAVALQPNFAVAHANLGNALVQQGRIDPAIAHCERALSLKPDYAEAHYNLGNALAMQGQTDRAIEHYQRAVALQPNFADAHNNLGLALALQGQTDRAIAHYERALSLKPDYAEAHNNLGSALVAQRRIDPAVAHYERALSLKPDYAEAHNNLGLALALQGRIDQVVAHYERALTLWPDNVVAHNSLLLTLNYVSDKDPVAVYAAHLDFAKRWEAPLSTSIQSHANDRSRERRLRIGYVSSDFKQHSVSYFIEPVLAHHDHERFEIFCYSNQLQEDEVTERLKSHADHWCRLVGLSDELVAQRVRADKIDILIDLSGHTGSNRLLVFARKPAPIQITWLGYPGTTGMSAMDYRLTDRFADPPGMTEHLHSEKLIRLPECFSCYQPPGDAPEVSGLPAREKGYVTFGSFNNLAKITPEVKAVWAKILQAVPGSRLTLKNPALGENATRQAMRQAFTELGIAPERLELLGHEQSQRAHLERYRSIDIGLDPFPYNGATTTCEALWMGVPVVVLAGGTHAGRVGVSQMSNLGLTDLIGHTPEEYIATASRLATDLEHLSALRAGLRTRMAASPLTEARRFTNNLEQAYRVMWNGWCLKGVS
jgi:predicted O-linked N-acetylglucosamine transferase (SPINDLY family)